MLLRKWLNENRDQLRQKRKIEERAEEWRSHHKSKDYLLQGKPLADAKAFHKQQANTLSLSDLAVEFIQRSSRQKRVNQLRAAGFLTVPVLVVFVAIVPHLRQRNYAQARNIVATRGAGTREALEVLTEGCHERQFLERQQLKIPNYLITLLFGNCTNLSRTNLRGADLRDANLSGANLSTANLVGAYLTSANLHSINLSSSKLMDTTFENANLYGANLSGANFSNAGLTNTDLSNANLSGALLFFINSREVLNLEPLQLKAKPSPFLCNVALPTYSQQPRVNPNRDCDRIPQLLSSRYDISLEELKGSSMGSTSFSGGRNNIKLLIEVSTPQFEDLCHTVAMPLSPR
ncbi:MAG: pentapeptide repeat-containing protein [Leptolyngbyaceae cyanobacterium RM2_2_4]|nr:pentapeptide repeat-containing protein [Leptolyngbyaceae cyanobacterium RM2_2_4]